MHKRMLFAVMALTALATMVHATVIFDSVEEYSTVQGSNNWYYGYYDGDSTIPYTSGDFEEFPQITSTSGWIIHRGDPSGYWTSMGRYGGHPNGPVANYYKGTLHWSVRRWVSDVQGTISISGNLSKSSTFGDGTICKILVNDDVVYSQKVLGTEPAGIDYSIEVEINIGDTIDFAITPGANDLYDSTRFNAIGILLSTVEPPVIGIVQTLNIDDCIEATSPEGALVSAYVDDFIDATNIMYYWSTTDGMTASGPDFDFQLGLNQSTIVFLTIKDLNTGDEASSFKEVRVSDTTGPYIEIIDPREGECFNGNNLFLNVFIQDAVDTDIVDYTVNMGMSAVCPVDPESGYSSIHLFKPAAGDVVPTDISVTAQDASGNISQATVQVMLQQDNRVK